MNSLEVANVFVNMTGTEMNTSQRKALGRLLESTYEQGQQADPIFQCHHCGTEGVHQELMVCDLSYFDDKEQLFCKHCRKYAVEQDAKNQRVDAEKTDVACDGCKRTVLAPDSRRHYDLP